MINFRDGRRQASAPGFLFCSFWAETPRKEVWTGGHWNVLGFFKPNLHLKCDSSIRWAVISHAMTCLGYRVGQCPLSPSLQWELRCSGGLQRFRLGPRWGEGESEVRCGEERWDRPTVMGVASSVSLFSLIMIIWSVVLQYFVTRLVLVCIYVTPPMKHIYTGIKYIALYNIIYVCGIKGIF